ncbi:hypothetical protein [Bradyrhizobium sp. Bra78]|uniref:hypothetical protein n=1 Tax=Bradyrhizobium sp. Bra78 TaxID=2926010 RepID=UPI0021CA34B7|nr:hypothetical protein [Bradyrhizobium sp. Bra78]
MAKMTNEEYRDAGRSHLNYFREVLNRDGDDAKLELHADHLRALLAAASPDKR